MSFLQYIKSRLVLAAWLIGGASVMTFFVCTVCRSHVSWFVQVDAFISSIWIAMWFGNEFISHSLDKWISWTKKPIQRLVIGIIAMLVYTVSMTFILVRLFESTVGMKGTSFPEMVYGAVLITFIITLFMTGRSFLFEWKKTAVESEKFQKESMTAKYETLKSQVNPHFLFNSLNVLTNLVYEDQDKAAKFIKQLSEVYRYVLDTRNREVVTLQEELRFLDSYVFLQQIRFGKSLNVEISRELSLNGRKSQVVPLAMQMLIENAIKHNVISVEVPLHIKLYEENNWIVVENDIQLKKQLPEESGGLGLENIQNRYSFLTDRKVVINREGKSFVVKLPIVEIQ